MMDANENGPDRVLRHVVLLAFKATSNEDEIRQVEQAFVSLRNKIDEIVDLEWGTDVSVEGKANGFTHCVIVTFRDEAGRDAYLPHPAHKAFGQLLRPHVEKVLVIDFWARH